MKYHNLDLEAFDYRVEGGVERFRVRVTHSPAGEQGYELAESVMVPPDLREQLEPLETGALGLEERTVLEELIEIGEKLAGLLFPQEARRLLELSRATIQENEALRIRLKMHTYALTDLPWEYAYIAPRNTPSGQKEVSGFLALDRRLSLVRYEVMAQPLGNLAPVGDDRLRLAVLMSNPGPGNSRYAELDVDGEKNQIERALRGIDGVHPEFYLEGTVEALEEALAPGAHIFHYYGHGGFQGEKGAAVEGSGGKGYVILVTKDRRIRPFAADMLAQNLLGRGVRLAVLNACEGARRDPVNALTGVAPALIAAGIPAVVGMQYRIHTEDATAFNQGFYRALAAGQSVDAAVTDGRLAILNRSHEFEHDWGVPVLYLRADEGVLFPRPAEGPSARPAPGVGDRQVQRDVTVGRLDVQVDKRVLRTTLVQHWSLEELEALCADVQQALADDGISLQVNLEMVGGSGKMGKVLNLIGYLDRRGYLGYLVEAMRQMRPDVEW